jgi:uncharacterized protein (DUF2147 family)
MLGQRGGTVRYRFPALLAVSFAAATPAWAQDATGEWLVEDGVAQIRIVNCDNAFWGVVSWEKDPSGRDTENPDPSKRNRPTLGMPTLLDMRATASGKWKGKVYNAEDGQTYDASITLRDANTLHIEGCVLGFLCGGENWTRAQAKPSSGAAGDPATAPAASICASVGAGGAH